MRTSLNQDVVSGILLIIVTIVLYINSLEFSKEAAMYPQALIYLLLFLAVLITLRGLKKMKKQDGSAEQKGDSKVNIKNSFITFFLVILYTILIYIIGFFPATGLFLIIFLLYMGVKNWKTYLFTVLGLNLFIYLLFVVQLNVQLPIGIFFK